MENTKLRPKRGIYIDLYPLDGLADTMEESVKRFRRIDFKFNLLLCRSTRIRKGRHPLKNAAVLLLSMIPAFLIDNKKLQRQIDQLCRRADFDHCKYGGNLLGNYRVKEIMENRIFGTPTLYPFENIFIYGVEHYDEFLTHLYGDWRKLPPESKRVTHHQFKYCDLHKSYLDD